MTAPRTLTPRQRRIVELLAEGLNMDQIGERLGISRHTVRTQLQNAHNRVQVHSSAALVGWMFRTQMCSWCGDVPVSPLADTTRQGDPLCGACTGDYLLRLAEEERCEIDYLLGAV